MSTETEMLSRREILIEIRELIAQYHFKSFHLMKKNEAMRMLQALRLYKPVFESVPTVPKVKPGPLGSRIIPTQRVDVDGADVVAPVVPRKRPTVDRSKPRTYVAEYIENAGLVSFKD